MHSYYFLKIRFNIIFPSKPWVFQVVSPSNPVGTSPFPYAQVRGSDEWYVRWFSYLRWWVVSTSSKSQPAGPPLIDCPRLLIQYPTLHIGDGSSIRDLRTRHTVVTGTHFLNHLVEEANKFTFRETMFLSECKTMGIVMEPGSWYTFVTSFWINL
jgi:hypothetical protein